MSWRWFALYWYGWPVPLRSRRSATDADADEPAPQLVLATIDDDHLVLDCLADEPTTIRVGLTPGTDRAALRHDVETWMDSSVSINVRLARVSDGATVSIVGNERTVTLPVAG